MRYAPWIRHIFLVTNGQIPSPELFSTSDNDYMQAVSATGPDGAGYETDLFAGLDL